MTTNGAVSPQVKAKKRELAACRRRIATRKTKLDEEYLLQRQLFRDLIGLGVPKSEIARWAGVSHAAVNDTIGKA